MKRSCFKYLFLLFVPLLVWSQEEQSAEVFLEEYTDEFQEAFFEALKQKGIQNYDRAVSHLLKCKELDASISVVDYELARTYFLDKKFPLAVQYGIVALNSDPSNYWYLENLVTILEKQGNSIENLKGSIPIIQGKLRENLAFVYFHKGKYEDALETLKGLEGNHVVVNLRRKINDSIQSKNKKKRGQPEAKFKDKEMAGDNDVTNYRNRIEKLISSSNFGGLETIAKEALAEYPLQPYFYYAYGIALTKTSREKQGIAILEEGLDYILDDNILLNKMYQELAQAYRRIGNEKRAKEYLGKIEPRS